MPKLIAGLAVAALVAGPAFAQTTPPGAGAAGQAPEARAGRFLTELPGAMRGSKLIGIGVIGQDHVRIGSIDDLLVDRDGRILAVVIGVGGFLGIGEKNVAIPYDMLVWNTGDVSRATSPSAGTTQGASAGASAPEPRPERMPGAEVDNRVLNAVPENRSGTVDPGTGRSMPDTAGQTTATVPVASGRGPVRAEVRLTKADLQNAPEFRYDRDGAGGSRR